VSRRSDDGSAAIRAFSIIETVAAADRPVSIAEVVHACGLPKPTAFRILTLLERNGLVSREPDAKRYTAGERLDRLGRTVLSNGSLRATRHAILQGLAAKIGETCNFTMLDGARVVYLDRVETAWPLRVTLQTGSHVPLHCTASGKLLLALLPKAKRDRLIASLPLTAHTERTIVRPEALRDELDRIRARQYSTDDEEYLSGLVCVAAPVKDSRGRACAALAVHAPVSRMPLAAALSHLPGLRRAAEEMARSFNA
jgi:DNA-binding IclR family transcriptional regulator